jgi:hypothetical protein
VNREHVTPKKLGGPKGYPNLALSHVTCNRIKDDTPPTEEQLARLAAINAGLTREEVVAAAAEEIELLHNPRIADRLPGAGRIRSRAVEFLASTLPELSRGELITAFRSSGAYGGSKIPDAAPTNSTAAPSSAASQVAAMSPQPRAFAPDPLEFANGAEGWEPTVARPRILLALAGVVGLAASLVAAAPMIGLLRQLSLLQPIWIAPALLVAAIAVVLLGGRRGGTRTAGAILFGAAVIAGLGATAVDPQAHTLFNDMMAGNNVDFRLPNVVSPLALGALALSAVAWLLLTLKALGARAPAAA